VIASMTGFGSAAVREDGFEASVQARSLNHRYLDLSVHLPRRLAALEPDLRRLVQARLQRGKVELSLSARWEGAEPQEVRVAAGLVASLVASLRELKQRHGLAGEVTPSDVARFPGALEASEAAGEPSLPRERLLALAGEAVAALDRQRRAEGSNLEAALRASLEQIGAAATRLAELSEASRAARRETLAERVREAAAGLGLDEARTYAEVVRVVERADVAEEIERLRSHVGLCLAALAGSGACGKQLDFLAQELMREANTIGSKAASAAVIQEVVALKTEIERFREQVQNVE
jgi:uncharacterized protein (TIGR00255 family)